VNQDMLERREKTIILVIVTLAIVAVIIVLGFFLQVLTLNISEDTNPRIPSVNVTVNTTDLKIPSVNVTVNTTDLKIPSIKTTGPGNTPASTTNQFQEKPNIIVIMTDDQDDGMTLKAIPKIKSLIGDQGVTFKNSFVDNSICCPSRSTFLTGQNSNNHGVFFLTPKTVNGVSYGGGYGDLIPTEANTLPVWLQDSGYTTAMIGKYVNGYDPETGSVPPGWDTWFAIRPFFFDYYANVQGVSVQYGNNPEDYVTDVLTGEAVTFIESQDDARPFFLVLNHPAPHVDVSTFPAYVPIPAPRHDGLYSSAELPNVPSYNEIDTSDKPTFIDTLTPLMDTNRQEYILTVYRKALEALLSVDESVEEIVSTLESTGKLNNSIIIFTSDNGYLFGEHRTYGKTILYEESIRVPLMIRGPGINTGEMRDELVNNVDIPATIVELTGVSPGRVLDGKSLIPLFTNISNNWRSSLFVESNDNYRNSDSGTTVYGIYRGIRTKNFVFAEHGTPQNTIEHELYDLRNDPYQLQSKHNDPYYSSVFQDLEAKLSVLKSCVGDTCWITDPEPTLTLPPIAPIAKWKLDESSGTTATDSSGNKIDGTVNGATWTSGVNGNALSFDGVDDHIKLLGTNSMINPNKGSLAMWIKPESNLGLMVAYSAKKNSENNIEILWSGDKQEITLKWKGSGVAKKIQSNAISDTDGLWHHLVLTWDKDADEVKAYINGVKEGSTLTDMPEFIGPINNEVKLGTQGIPGGSNFFKGKIDDVQIYSKALKQSEIDSIYSLP
jgi:N-acetylglucosamine-6-sulfatase